MGKFELPPVSSSGGEGGGGVGMVAGKIKGRRLYCTLQMDGFPCMKRLDKEGDPQLLCISVPMVDMLLSLRSTTAKGGNNTPVTMVKFSVLPAVPPVLPAVPSIVAQ